jgi:hypothetical protein
MDELEKIIAGFQVNVLGGKLINAKPRAIASALRQEGYVKLSEVEIDREKLEQILLTTPYQMEMQNQIKNYVNAITLAKPIQLKT